jgi:signal transduction histidine kinase/CHASE3 domain sensor protein
MRRGLVARFAGGALLLGVALALAFVAVLVTIGARRAAVDTAQRSGDVLTSSFQTQKLVLDIETGVRGYLLTREPDFLQPYHAAIGEMPAQLASLERLTRVDPAQHARARAIAAAVTDYIDDWARPAASAGSARNSRRVQQMRGKVLVDAIRARFNTFDADQHHLVDVQSANASHLADLALILGSVGAVAALVLMALYALYARAAVGPVREVARAARRVAEGDLTARVAEGGTAEVGELTTAFNRMAAALHAGREELETYNDELEAQQSELQSLLEAVAQEKARTERLHEFAQALAATTDLPGIGSTILDHMCEEAGADVGVLYAHNPTLDVCQLAACRGVGPQDVSAAVIAGQGIAGRALSEGRPVAVAPGEAGLPVAVLGEARPARHQLSFPLLLGDGAAGVVTIARVEDRPFSAEEVTAVTRLTGQAAVALARARMQQQTERSLGLVQSVVDATPAPIALVAPGGGLLFQNSPMAELRAQLADDARASRAFDAAEADPAATVRDEILLDSGRVMLRYAAPISDDRDAPAGRIVVLRDVSREREADRLKDEFFALVSHELRTPLTSIIGYLELALEDDDTAPLDPQRRQFLEVVDRNAARLLRLVGDLLFAAQVKAGTLALERDTVDVARLARQAVEAAGPRAAQGGVDLEVEAPGELWMSQADGDRLGQMLDNLVVNGLKFTPAGGRVTVACVPADDEVHLSVRDTGLGIAPADQARLFERFFRAPSAVTEGVPGVGLGLTIVQAIVQGHGGTSSVDSAPGMGTTFRVTMPLRGGRFSDRARRERAGAARED